ncbi:methyltransferase type 12 [Anoxybacillus sp. B7M1]|jgi:cyclopropane fatty-acyl-phospholipid synthase-like methyltransferase|uniref:class I SAM-dependent DNA methyltransferase n=1 Tax=unclassified Anoxybacillus TaxID=2639704 RepID=UPI0005CDAD7B|nr:MULTISPECIES: class I SAM-dependent methyltransferase [unclassified Anoxybacillus]ANB58435.1 methyltransferase type 12 [Anoxybacillus sp. B2M1]ANB65078.1 methyltransferase type 12 [Anoxybacillus sp. B7M1]
MTYESFAYWYDELMKEAPYDKWKEFVNKKVEQYGRKGTKRLLDVGCGTGELAVRLAQSGFSVTGVDQSENMLAIAQAKAEQHHVHIEFFEQDMRDLNGFSPFDAVLIFCDSLNYLPTEQDVQQTFRRIYELLHKDGLLLFDVHSIYKMDHIFQDAVFASNDESISYIWLCNALDTPHTVVHELTFFVQEEDGRYERYDEDHIQRTFPAFQYEQWLKEAGFTVMEISADFTDRPLHDTAERLFFVAKK